MVSGHMVSGHAQMDAVPSGPVPRQHWFGDLGVYLDSEVLHFGADHQKISSISWTVQFNDSLLVLLILGPLT